ncbi:MAG: hypothetical protein IPM64_10495 [Phycisphaerales bacterium]|nr:hypothetical protein [Phycisphaerales bacterium]
MNSFSASPKLADLLAPLSPSEFRRDFLGKKAVHIKGHADRFKDLFGWRQFNRLLNSAPAPHSNSRLYKNNEKTPIATDALDVIRFSQEGATVIVEDGDRYDEGLGRFVDALSDEIGDAARTNIYASSPDNQGFPLHYDTHDFLILQVEGFVTVHPSAAIVSGSGGSCPVWTQVRRAVSRVWSGSWPRSLRVR